MTLEELKALMRDGPESSMMDEEMWALTLVEGLRHYSNANLDESADTFNYLLKCLEDLISNGICGTRLDND